MKKPVLFAIALVMSCLAITANAQSDGFCAQHTLLKERLKDPVYAAQFEKTQAKLNETSASYTASNRRGTVYKVPIVFHILHNGGAENISNEQVRSALISLNKDFRKLNPEASQVHPDFLNLAADIEVEFVLATIAPDGTCFNGITRTKSEASFQGEDGYNQVQEIINGNDVYQGEWSGEKYLNVFSCAKIINGAAGYTYLPSGDNSMTNGIWMLHNYVGDIGTGNPSTRGVLSHEAGHWLNLPHVWGSTNSAGVECGDDFVADTPETRGSQGCNLNENFCGPRANVENYMDYAGCRKMFTIGQGERMRATLDPTGGGRELLCTPGNLAATGANGSPLLCNADFTSTNSSVCSGATISFVDESFNGVTAWNWSFPGGVPATSTERNPTVTYSTPGTYSVSLSVSNGTQTLSVSKAGYVKVFQGAGTIPLLEGFEGASQLSNLTSWSVSNPGNDKTWQITNKAKLSGVNSAWIENYMQEPGSVDELISGSVDLSSINATSKVTLSFRFSYRKTDESNDDFLKVFLSSDCGSNWEQRKTLHGVSLSDLVSNQSWVPSNASHWTTVHMTNVISMYWNENFRYKFRFEGDGGNNLYLDNINIYSGAPSETIVLGLDDATELESLNAYPNPADDELHVRFNSLEAQPISILLVDVFGKELQLQQINAATGSNLVLLDTQELAAGMYFARVVTGSGSQQVAFVKK